MQITSDLPIHDESKQIFKIKNDEHIHQGSNINRTKHDLHIHQRKQVN